MSKDFKLSTSLYFEEGLRAALLAKKPRGYRRLVEFLESEDTPLKRHRLARMENRARIEMGFTSTVGVDWSTLVAWIKTLLPILLALLTMFGAEEGGE